MKRHLVGLAIVVAAQSPGREASATAVGAPGERVPVVVELFTSEGCSSCPPADAVLARLEHDQPVEGAEVIALGFHVDYWDYLGWRDPFGAPANSERQRAYSRLQRAGSIYTPQAVVDGEQEFVGSDQPKAERAIAAAARRPKAKVTVTVQGDRAESRVDGLAAAGVSEPVDLLLVLTRDEVRVAVGRGENGGRTLAHTAVVLDARPLAQGIHDGNRASASVGRAAPGSTGRVVVLAQERQSRRIVGAGWTKLAPGD